MKDDLDDEIKQVFFDDSIQMIDAVEALLLTAEGLSANAVDTLFRTTHNIKGGAMALGFAELTNFAHLFEDLLSLLKKGEIQSTPNLTDTLIRGVDVVKTFVLGLQKTDSFSFEPREVAVELRQLLETRGSASATGKAKAKEIESEARPAPEVKSESVTQSAAATHSSAPIGNRPKSEKSRSGAKAPEREDFLRVSTGKVDLLLNFIGELVIYQSIMSRHKIEETTNSDHALQTISFMGKLVNEIQDVAMGLRMNTVKSLFQKMQRTVRDIAMAQGKDVAFTTEGEHVELDRTIIDRMNDPLVHLIRNAVDHGIEDVTERAKKGKNSRAMIHLSARQENDMVLIIVKDDGKGLDPGKLIAKAKEKGLVSDTDSLTNEEAYALIFKPGFSTKEQVTDVSGRGVGMDVVAKSVEDMKGSIRIETEVGKGTSFIISLPLSLSIISGMVVAVAKRKYVIPVAQLVETLEYRKLKIETCTKEGRMINLRGEIIPVVSLAKLLGAPREAVTAMQSSSSRPGVVVSSNGRKYSFEVDELLGQQQVVIKKLGSKMEDLPGVVGGAILSNGEPSLVLSLQELSEEMRRTLGGRYVA